MVLVSNFDKETLNLVLLWQANIGVTDMPDCSSLPNSASKSLNIIHQKQKLQKVKNDLIKNEPIGKVLKEVNNWLNPDDRFVNMGALMIQNLIKSHIYDLAGRAPLAELCAQIVLAGILRILFIIKSYCHIGLLRVHLLALAVDDDNFYSLKSHQKSITEHEDDFDRNETAESQVKIANFSKI